MLKMIALDLISKASWVDLVALVLIVWGILVGLKRGFEVEGPKLIGILVSTGLTLHFYEFLAGRLQVKVAVWDSLSKLVTFAVMAIVTAITMKFVFQVLSAVVSLKFTPLISHVGGAVAAVLRLALLFSLFTYFLLLTPLAFLRPALGYDRSVVGNFFLTASVEVHSVFAKHLPVVTTPPPKATVVR